jgi:predicted dehydrogenase
MAELVKEGFLGASMPWTTGWPAPTASIPRARGRGGRTRRRAAACSARSARTPVDSIRSWLGEIKEVRGSLAPASASGPDPESGAPRPVTSDDYAAAWLRLEQGGEVDLTLSAVTREDPWTKIGLHWREGLARARRAPAAVRRAHGEAAYTEVPVEDAPLPPAGIEGARHALGAGVPPVRPGHPRGDPAQPGDRARRGDVRGRLRNQIVLDAVRESSKRGDWVAVDAAAQRA